jgi:multiphosphoryl transfer protein
MGAAILQEYADHEPLRGTTAMSGTEAKPPNGKILLKAPLSGVLMPIERVPDPVFAQKMVGDGVSLDPVTSTLVSPCDGEVVQLHAAGHAVTIFVSGGVEVLMHIGLDTVALKGQGFSPHVKKGDKVRTGDPLIGFDADFIATHARSLLTEIVITNMDLVAALDARAGNVRAGEDVILELTLATPVVEEQAAAARLVTSEAVLVPNPTGLHARPAAVLANRAKKFRSKILLQKGEQRANAKSVVALMGLAVNFGDKVNLVAEGPDADAAIAALLPLVAEGLGDEGTKPTLAPASIETPEIARPAPRPKSDDPNLLLGVAASPGLAVGQVYQVRQEEMTVPEQAEAPNTERRRLADAVEQAKLQLEALQDRLKTEADPGKAAIFAAHEELLEDPDLQDIAESAIAKGKSAAFGWRHAVNAHAATLASLHNELLAQRANDLRDVGRRVLRILLGMEPEDRAIPANTVLIAEDLAPSDTASLDRSLVLGFATTSGGATSHVAILARSLGIPAVAGIDPAALSVPNGSPVILNGSKGSLRLNPTADEVTRIRTMQERQAERRRTEIEHAMEPALTIDGHRVEVAANIGGAADAREAVALGAEGVGLLRSEFLFLQRASAPDEEEQTAAYREIASVLGPERPLIIRTLDVGGDKPLSYMPVPKEDNPFLGQRGIRLLLERPEILRTQIRAILRATEGADIRVMFPMIATLEEWRAARALFEQERVKLGVPPLRVGIMVEIAAAAIMADQFAAEADFFSIGTNDLTQYTLAMDRGHPKLAPQVDGLNPAVLRLIQYTVEAAHRHDITVGVCGGIAGDSQAVPILVGLGVDELSVSVPAIPAIKAQVRTLSFERCREFALNALTLGTAAEVRALSPAVD